MAEVFKGRVIVEGSWNEEGDANYMWEKMTTCIRKVASEVFGMTRGGGCKTKTRGGGTRTSRGLLRRRKSVISVCFLIGVQII